MWDMIVGGMDWGAATHSGLGPSAHA